MFKYFLIVIGVSQIIISLIEFVSPPRSFVMWKNWVLNRFFPVHGLALIFIGLPLTVYNGYLSTIIFYIGLLIVFTGPFILIYPEKIRKVFSNTDNVFSEKEVKTMIYLDAVFRFCTGVIFLVSCFKTFTN